jgi:catechol 2,3-dioxygenase-like lactoylglutathione lyase family enzyme
MPDAAAVSERELVSVLLRISTAVEQTAELLEAANEVHRRLVELHGALTDPLVDLELLLREAREAAEKATVLGHAADTIGVERTDFVNVATTDLERAMRFYGEVLGLPQNPRSSDSWPEFETGNLALCLAASDKTGVPFSPSNNAIALRVPDVAEARRRLEAAGVEFELAETYDSGVCHMAFFRDPDGNALILHRRYAPYSDGSLP